MDSLVQAKWSHMAIVHMISDTFMHHRELKFSELYQTQGHHKLFSKQCLLAAVSCKLVVSRWRESESCSVVSDSLPPHGLYSPWNSPGQNTGVGSRSLPQGIFPTQGSNPVSCGFSTNRVTRGSSWSQGLLKLCNHSGHQQLLLNKHLAGSNPNSLQTVYITLRGFCLCIPLLPIPTFFGTQFKWDTIQVLLESVCWTIVFSLVQIKFFSIPIIDCLLVIFVKDRNTAERSSPSKKKAGKWLEVNRWIQWKGNTLPLGDIQHHSLLQHLELASWLTLG